MAITTAQVYALLKPGINKVFGDYPQYPAEWKEIFEQYTSDMSAETDVEMRLLGPARMRSEGASTEYEDMGTRYPYTYNHVEISLGFIMTRKAIEDNLYTKQFSPGTRQLKNSFNQTKEMIGANVLNLAMDPNTTYGDGQPLLSTQHPIDVGVNSNTFGVQSELNETSLQDILVRIGQQRDAAGLIVKSVPKKVVVGLALQFAIDRLLNSTQRVDTPNNDINAIRNLGLLRDGFVVNHYLTNPKAWYVLTDMPDGMKYFQRTAFEPMIAVDTDTDNLKTKARERFSFGVSNHRAIAGSMPS